MPFACIDVNDALSAKSEHVRERFEFLVHFKLFSLCAEIERMTV